MLRGKKRNRVGWGSRINLIDFLWEVLSPWSSRNKDSTGNRTEPMVLGGRSSEDTSGFRDADYPDCGPVFVTFVVVALFFLGL